MSCSYFDIKILKERIEFLVVAIFYAAGGLKKKVTNGFVARTKKPLW